jgi:hypothetical protein
MEQFLNDNGTMIGIIVFAIAGGYVLFRKQINAAAFNIGKLAGAFLGRFKLDDEAEEIGQSFVDGMKSVDPATVNSGIADSGTESKEEIKERLKKEHPFLDTEIK